MRSPAATPDSESRAGFGSGFQFRSSLSRVPGARVPRPRSPVRFSSYGGAARTRTPNPEPRTPNPEPRIPNPEPRVPSPESEVPIAEGPSACCATTRYPARIVRPVWASGSNQSSGGTWVLAIPGLLPCTRRHARRPSRPRSSALNGPTIRAGWPSDSRRLNGPELRRRAPGVPSLPRASPSWRWLYSSTAGSRRHGRRPARGPYRTPIPSRAATSSAPFA